MTDRAANDAAPQVVRAAQLVGYLPGVAAYALPAILILALCAACTRTEERRDEVRLVPQLKPMQPRRVAFAPDDEDRLLILEAAGLVGVWDVADPAEPVRMAWIPDAAIDAGFSADGKEVVTAGRDGKVRWWSSVGGQLLRSSTGGHQGAARALAVGVDLVVSGGEDGALRLWNRDGTARGEPIAAHEGFVVSVAIGADGQLASAGTDEVIRLWEKDPSSPSGYRARILHQEEKAKRRLYLAGVLKGDLSFGWDHALVFSPGADALAAAAFDGGVRLWRAADWSVATTLNKVPGPHHVRALSWSSRGDVLAAGGFNGKVARWNAAGSSLGEIAPHAAPILSVALSPSGARFATTSSDDSVRLWRSDGALVAALPTGTRAWATAVALSPQGPLFASADGSETVRRLRIDGSPAEQIPTGVRRVTALAFSPNGELLVAGGDDGTIGLLGRDGNTTVKSKIWNFVDHVAVSPRGDVLALAGNPGNVELRNGDATPRTGPFRACLEKVFGFAFSPVEEVLAILCDDGGVKLWTLAGKPRGSLLEPGAGVGTRRGLAISASAELFASGDVTGVVGFWALPGRRLDGSLYVGLPIDAVGFHRGGLSVSANGNTVFFFDSARRLVATAVVAPEGVVAFLPDGWFAGSQGVERLAGAFRADGTPLSVAETAGRIAPEKVAAALSGW